MFYVLNMHVIALTLLFLNAATATIPLHPVCRFVCTPAIVKKCPVLHCGPNESPQHPKTCSCCKECLPNKPSGPGGCQKDCSGIYNCPLLRCAEGYEPAKPDCGCCDVCKPIKKCQTDCSRIYHCPLLRCKEGYRPVKPKCGCCDVCEKIPVTIEPTPICDIVCTGRYNCPLLRCAEGQVPIKPKCGCCEICGPAKKPTPVCDIVCTGRYSCPALRCAEGQVPVKPKCGCCPICGPAKSTCDNSDERYNSVEGYDSFEEDIDISVEV